MAGHQETTRTWWNRRGRVELFVSQAVVDEASQGNAVAAARRLAFLEGISVLGLNAEIDAIANQLLRANAVPAKARIDAVHIAVAAINHMEYLVTWNLAHIANAAIRGRIEQTCRGAGLRAPVICTPEELPET